MATTCNKVCAVFCSVSGKAISGPALLLVRDIISAFHLCVTPILGGVRAKEEPPRLPGCHTKFDSKTDQYTLVFSLFQCH